MNKLYRTTINSSNSLVELLRRRIQLHHLPPEEKLETIDSSNLVIITIATICTILFALFVWMSFTKIEEITVTFGSIVPKGAVYNIQHLEGGIISQSFVHDGDEVKKGQLLLRLDPTATVSELQELQSKSAGLMEGSVGIDTQGQINALQREGITFSGKLDTLNTQYALQNKELAMYEKLVKAGAASRRDYLRIQQTVNQTQGEINDTKAKYVEVQQLITKLADRVHRLEIVSPAHGLVQGFNNDDPGVVIKPGDVIMQVVPLDDELVVETKIPTTEIGNLKMGNVVKVKVRTFDYTRYGIVTGKLSRISASTFTDEKNIPYYKGVIILDRNYVGDDVNQKILPGMTVEADINTGKKSLMQYLLKPIQVAMTSSFHEK